MKQIYIFFLALVSCSAFAQQSSVKGMILDGSGKPVEFATAALLEPADSTLAYFGISNANGNFEIKSIRAGNYLMQLSFVGYITYDTLVTAPFTSGDTPLIFILRPRSELLNTVEIEGERTPIQIKGDTIEYNAAAFKTQPDASAEDLLKKLPGLEVDQNGNIKAQGEDVQQVLVDGKEFFSSDPAVATKNLPADAIDKVQVFDKTSDEADFTGVDDGNRSKTINLLLKEDKKSMWMGDLQAGAGTDEKYQVSAKAYRFTKTDQFAALGMLNNINQFGFSINDYIDFNGGMNSMMHGGGFRINSSDEMPVNFGQQVTGLITSGAGGLNYMHEAIPGNRFNISYLGNGYQKNILENIYTENFSDSLSFNTNENSNEKINNYYHRLNINFRNKPDSMQSIFGKASAALNYGNSQSDHFTETYSSDSLTNTLESATYEKSHSIEGNTDLSYIHKTNSNWKFIKAAASLSGKSTLTDLQWNNITNFTATNEFLHDDSYQNGNNYQIDYSATISASRKLKNQFYFDPAISAGRTFEKLNREQGNLFDDTEPIDSLSPDFSRTNLWFKPSLAIKKNTKKTQWKTGIAAENIFLQNTLNEISGNKKSFIYVLPQFSLEKELREGRHIRMMYESSVNAPTATQLLPVTDYVNPLVTFTGNSDLKPEYVHNVNFNWILFDQFSFTSLFTHFSFTYTKDKINYAKTINPDFSQALTLINVPSDYNSSAGFSFSTPLRPLKINVSLEFNENFDRGINYVNTEENIISAFTHKAELSFDNRRKDKLDIRAGGSIKYTQAAYSISITPDSKYFTNTIFGEINYNPTDKWRLTAKADIDKYSSADPGQNTVIPLLQAQISRYILKSNRGTIMAKAYDILNRESGISQISAYNYFQQSESNTVGRYFLLSFKYRINKADQKNNIDVKVN